MLAADVLRGEGFIVVEAKNAAETLRVIESNATEICVLFTDINMPGVMDGLELAQNARLHWPWIKVLLASGAIFPSELPEGSRFVPKPYELDLVIRHIRELASSA